MSEKIRLARQTMREAFEEDEGFRIAYVANIAMRIHDSVHADDVDFTLPDGTKLGRAPLNLNNVKDCNILAEDLLKLIFGE